jgi:hypothetical protein
VTLHLHTISAHSDYSPVYRQQHQSIEIYFCGVGTIGPVLLKIVACRGFAGSPPRMENSLLASLPVHHENLI